MANNSIKVHVKLRSDTAANWISNNPTLVDGELSIVKVDNSGAINFKLGNGGKYNDTSFIKFNKISVGNGTVTEYKKDSIVVDSAGSSPVTLSFPTTGGTLATTEDIQNAIANIGSGSGSGSGGSSSGGDSGNTGTSGGGDSGSTGGDSSNVTAEDIVRWNVAYNQLNNIRQQVADLDFQITEDTTVSDVAQALVDLINIIKAPPSVGSLNDDDTTVERLVTATGLNPSTATSGDIAAIAGMTSDDVVYSDVTNALATALN